MQIPRCTQLREILGSILLQKGCISDDCFTTKGRCAKGFKHDFLRQRSELFLIAYARIVLNYFARREL